MKYRSVDDTYKKLTVVFITTTIILLIVSIILLKFTLNFKSTIEQTAVAMKEVETQTSQFEITYTELATNYEKVAQDLVTAQTQLQLKEQEINYLKQMLSVYQKPNGQSQSSATQPAYQTSPNYTQTMPNNSTQSSQTSNPMSVPSLNINPTQNTNSNSANQQNNQTTNLQQEVQSGMNTVVIE